MSMTSNQGSSIIQEEEETRLQPMYQMKPTNIMCQMKPTNIMTIWILY